ncbi:dihydrolipoamide acetyltransferase family protein [soil metagenome]
MTVIVKMPQLGESIVEGTVARWLKAPGDSVTKFEPLLEITTDKIDTEIPAPASGVLLEIVAPEGKTVRVGSTLAHIGEPGERNGAAHTLSLTTQAEAAAPAKVAPSTSAYPAVAPKPQPQAKPIGRDFISPVVARIASEHNIDLAQVAGSGASGRVTKKDMLTYIEEQQLTIAPPIPTAMSDQVAAPSPRLAVAEDEILTPLTAMRRAIAQHMVHSVQTSPHATTIFEVDMNAVVQHRETQKRALADKGLHLTYTPYFVAAVAAALRTVPQVNSRFSEEGIVTSRRIHIGVAVALAEGLIVPVIRDADEKNLQGLARAVNELAQQARNGKLAPDASKGGTFSITNHGVSGSLIGTPIINQPQAGILGIGAIVKRPVVRSSSASLLPSADDALVIRPMCYLSFSFDHRILDGAKADEFLTRVKEKLENWKDN